MRTRLVLAGLSALVLATGCTASGGTAPGSGASGGAASGAGAAGAGAPASTQQTPTDPNVTVRPEVAPASTGGNFAFAARGIQRQNGLAIVDLDVAARDDVRISWSDITVTTNTGLKLVLPTSTQPRAIDADKQAAVQFAVPLADAGARELTVALWDSENSVELPLPDEGKSFVWNTAPVRQMAPAAGLQRSKEVDLFVDSVKTEGLVTEVAVRATNWDSRLELCNKPWNTGCSIVESNGVGHPLIGGGPYVESGLRAHALLRFLGQVSPDSTTLTLHVPHDAGAAATPITLELPSHDDSLVRPVPASLARPAAAMTPINVTESVTGTKFTIDAVDVLEDRVQMHIKATGGNRDYRLTDFSPSSREWLRATEPNGYVHTVVKPAASELAVPAGGTLDATLVFTGAVPKDVTSLNLDVTPFNTNAPLRVTVPLPAASGTPGAPTDPSADPSAAGDPSAAAEPSAATDPAAGSGSSADPAAPDAEAATFGSVRAADPAADPAPEAFAPSPVAFGPSAAPTQITFTNFDLAPLPTTTSYVQGKVVSSIAGVASAPTVASGPTVDAKADAEAQKSLKDLGAQRTTDGYVLTLPETVLFDYNAADVKPAADATLAKVAKLLTYYDKVQIGVNGHTDNTGEAAYNLDLSKRRAQAVATALSGKGIATGRMKVQGFGLTQPVASNATDAGKAKNRRVEIVLRENA